MSEFHVLAATYVINRLLVKNLKWLTSYELLYGTKSIHDHLRVIGCLTYAHNVVPGRDKMDHRGIKYILLSYSSSQKGYKLYDWAIGRIFMSMDVQIFEDLFPFQSIEHATSCEPSMPLFPTSFDSTYTYIIFETRSYDTTLLISFLPFLIMLLLQPILLVSKILFLVK